jgi:hypothetical protein
MNTSINIITNSLVNADALVDGFVGCVVAAAYIDGSPSPEDYDNMISSLAGRSIFTEVDLLPVIKSQLALRYVLDEEEFIKSCTEKVTPEWSKTIFAICCHLIMDRKVTPVADNFIKSLAHLLQLDPLQAKQIRSSLELLHKGKAY